MTGKKPKLDAAYKGASSLTFEFEDAQVSEVNQLAVNKFISGNKVDTSVGGGILKALEEDRLYVITSIVKSKKFKTQATQSDGSSVQVDIPVVKEMVGGAVQIQSGGSSDSNITFEGANPLVFGFQAAQMEFEKGIFKGLKQAKGGRASCLGVRLRRRGLSCSKQQGLLPTFGATKAQGSGFDDTFQESGQSRLI